MNKMKNEMMMIRVSTQLKKQIKKKAESDGLDLSSYVRMLLVKDLKGKNAK